LNLFYAKTNFKHHKTSFIVSRFSTIKEIFELYFNRRKFYMFPLVLLLIALIGVTSLAQSGLVAFIYPI